MNIVFPDKDPDEILDYQIDWTTRLEGDTISSSEWVIVSGVGLTANNAAKTDTTTRIWLTGGTEGVTYILRNRVVTAGLRTMDQTAQILIATK